MQVSWQHLSEGYLPVGSTEKRTKDVGGDILLQDHLETDSRDRGMINEAAVMKIVVTIIITPFSCQLDPPSPVLTRGIDYSAVCCLPQAPPQ